ncbi:hypothetical protein [Burkholderia sp. MBR-1]|uniref:hypothetical protein n=1 Tax=Burkholderia sp. MBR-1 TaxID=2732364 RepID=UPI0015EE6E84|nr:hypothetical protein [Burkholderia sp. MBR-1]QMI48970.1 hypothetical protein MBR110_26250 [Burkholderia sp. MBR-1]
MAKILITLSALAISGAAVAAEASPVNGTLLSVSTFSAGSANVQLQKWQRPDGHVCNEYAKTVSYSQDGSAARIDLGTYCDDDKPL